MGRRIGLFGGTFDPPHTGHLGAAVAAKHSFRLDEVLLVVANDPWQKSGHQRLSAAHHRLAMVRLLVKDFDAIEASDLEICRGGPSYTIETVNELLAHGDEVTLIVGADVAMGMCTWERYDELRELVEVAVVDRPGYAPPELPGWRFQRVETESFDISSSRVRDRIGDGSSTQAIVPAAVRNYIDCHQLDWTEN